MNKYENDLLDHLPESYVRAEISVEFGCWNPLSYASEYLNELAPDWLGVIMFDAIRRPGRVDWDGGEMRISSDVFYILHDGMARLLKGYPAIQDDLRQDGYQAVWDIVIDGSDYEAAFYEDPTWNVARLLERVTTEVDEDADEEMLEDLCPLELTIARLKDERLKAETSSLFEYISKEINKIVDSVKAAHRANFDWIESGEAIIDKLLDCMDLDECRDTFADEIDEDAWDEWWAEFVALWNDCQAEREAQRAQAA